MYKYKELIKKDLFRMKILSIVHSLNLPDCYVAAGFFRNFVWDYMYSSLTKLNDIDIVFYDSYDSANIIAKLVLEQLNYEYPDINWDVKNQAYMHIKNGDAPYIDTLDAMRYWPEKETAIGVALQDGGALSIISAFGFDSLLAGKVSYNNKRALETFLNRVSSKRWLKIWPQLQVQL